MTEFVRCIKTTKDTDLQVGKVYPFSHRYVTNIAVHITANRFVSAPQSYFEVLNTKTFDAMEYLGDVRIQPIQVLTIDGEPLGIRYQTSNNQFFDMEIEKVFHRYDHLQTSELQDFDNNGVYATQEERANKLLIVDLSENEALPQKIQMNLILR